MRGSERPSLTLLTLNVNGLRSNSGKRRALFHGLLNGRYDVVCLQETHHSSLGEARKWCEEGSGAGSPWLGPCFWSHLPSGGSQSCGVAILFGSRIPIQSLRQINSDPHTAGRILRVDFSLRRTQYTVVSVYAPCVGSQRNTFFSDLRNSLVGASQRYLLVGGDFNCILDPFLDQVLIVPSGQLTATLSHGLVSSTVRRPEHGTVVGEMLLWSAKR